jgi:NAD(P)-dependent dehydrogenase (short-subunit alcohol dehydrogenase family)
MAEMPSRKVILITGSSSGIGRLAAETLLSGGHLVYASMRNVSSKNREAAESLRNKGARVVELDVTGSESVNRAVKTVLEEAGHLDVLVNNAGHMAIGITEAFTEAQVQAQMDVNFFGPVRLCRAVLPHMRARREGLIIHVTSVVGRLLFPACAFYCASKFALEAYAEVLHFELTEFGVDSVIVEPGPFPTRLVDNSPEPADRARAESYGRIANLRTTFIDTFQTFFSSPQSTNAQDVADAIAHLVETPAGQRPVRTVCPPDYGAIALNEYTAPIQAEVLNGLGMPEMARRAAGAAQAG